MSARSTLTLFAPAKVNLYLHVVGRRADGYHLLDSLAVFAGVGDSLDFAPSEGLSLSIIGPGADALLSQPDNIVIKAAHRLAEAAGVAPKATITLTKRLPVASGIGGGSADGAAALRGLAALWRVDIAEAELSRIGLALGADLPVCLRGEPTRMGGVGEILDPAPPLPPAWLVLVNPGVAVATPAVFKARDAGFREPDPLVEAPVDAAALAAALASRHNDLTAPAIRLAPVIGQVISAVGGQPDCLLARMSGSGATCFGLFGDETSANRAAAALTALQPGWWVEAAPILGKKNRH